MKFAVLILKDFIHQTAAMEAKMGEQEWAGYGGWAGSFLHCAQVTLLMEVAKGVPFSLSVWLGELGVLDFVCVTTGKGGKGWCLHVVLWKSQVQGRQKVLPLCCCSAAASLSQAVTDLTVISKYPHEYTWKATIARGDNPGDKAQLQGLLHHELFLVLSIVFPPMSVFGQRNSRHLNFTTLHVYLHSLHPLILSSFLWQKDGQMDVRLWDSKSCYKLCQVHWGNCILANVGWCNVCSGWMTWVFSFFLFFFSF